MLIFHKVIETNRMNEDAQGRLIPESILTTHETTVFPSKVVSVEEMPSRLVEGFGQTPLSKITYDLGTEIVVVGSRKVVSERISENTEKVLLKG